jgi:pilus assembly protein CpaF
MELRDLFEYRQDGKDEKGHITGHWTCSGVEPHFLVKLDKRNVELPKGLFKAGRE